uniref:CSON010452 protein n=1 Tax=Culicoides sonorensis TaxID=179676 RepID=A0A336M743_CULSO
MTKFAIFLAIYCCISYTTASWSAIGENESGEELIWVEYKVTPIQLEATNITHNFEFDGSDRNVDRISYIRFDYETDSSSTSLSLNKGGPSLDHASTSFTCFNCTYLEMTQRIYGFYKKTHFEENNSQKMTSIRFFPFILLIISLIQFNSIRSAPSPDNVFLGVPEVGQQLIWTDFKLVASHSRPTNITHLFEFDGTDLNVQRISYVTYLYDTPGTNFTIIKGGPQTNHITVAVECSECKDFSVTEDIYGFFN